MISYAPKTIKMNYNIENLDILTKKDDRLFLHDQLELLLGKIRYIPLKYRNTDFIDINLLQNKTNLKIVLSANLTTGPVSHTYTGDSLKSIIPAAFDKFADIINNEVEKIRKKYSFNKKNSFVVAISVKETELINLNEEERTNLFKSLITSTLPDMIGYIKRRVYSAKMANIKAFNSIFVKDVVSEVILQVHGRFQSDIANIRDFNIWNIQEADKVLNEILENSDHFRNEISFEQLVDRELSELEEEYTVDGDGDFVMNDEMDDYQIDKNSNENLLSLYVKDKEQIEEIEASDEEMSDKIFDDLIKLPIKYQSIYDLYYFELLEIDEIAKIKGMDPIEIEAILISIKELIAEKF